MRVVLQRVRRGAVIVGDQRIAAIGPGMVILLGIGHEDSAEKARRLVEKIVNLRIFEDDQRKMNRSILETGGEAIVVSQFTLYADTRKGRRPSYTNAAPPASARVLVEHFIELMKDQGVSTQGGEFGAHMLVEIINDGPVTICMEE